MEIIVGDIVRLRKQHPCGKNEWQVIRIGADIGIQCLGCNRYILLERSTFERKIKAYISRGNKEVNPLI